LIFQYVTAARPQALEVDGVSTSSLYAHKVYIWNSGDVPLKNLPVLFMFNTKEPDFKIFSVRHETVPTYEFGKIKEEGSTNKSKRFVFELLNPDDKDEVTILTNKWAILTVHSKAEGLKLQLIKQDRKKWFEWASIFISVIAAFIAILLKTIGEAQKEVFQWIKMRFKKKEE